MGRGFERELGGLCRNWCMLMLMLQTCLQRGGVPSYCLAFCVYGLSRGY